MKTGKYNATIMNAAASQSQGGTPCMEVTVRVDDEEGESQDRRIFVYFSTKQTDGAKKSVESNLRMLAVNGWNGSMTEPRFEDANVMVIMKEEMYENEMKERWEFLNKGFEVVPMQTSHMKALEARAKKFVKKEDDGEGAIDPEESPF